MEPYAGIDYNLTLCWLQHIYSYHGKHCPRVDLNLCQSRLYPPVRDLGWPRRTCSALLPISQYKSSSICRSSFLLFVHTLCSTELLFGFTLFSMCSTLLLFSLFKELTFIRSSLLFCAQLSSATLQLMEIVCCQVPACRLYTPQHVFSSSPL